VIAGGLPLFAAEIVKENNAEALNSGSSWVGGVAPGAADVAVWSSTVSAANMAPLNAAATWDGIKILNPGGPVTVGGSALLTLDGGSAPDINLAGATRDLTFEAPVSMGGAISNEVASGRTLTFAGPLAITASGNWARNGWGTVVYDGPVSSATTTTLELQRGTNIFTGRNGGLAFSSTNSGARIYVGRYAGSVATLIISNGVHEVRGVNHEANANFVGVGATGHLVMEGGSLTLAYLRLAINSGSGSITVNGGRLEATAGSNTADLNGYALMIGNNHQDSTSPTYGSGTLTVNGGEALFTNGIVKIGSKNSESTGALAIVLNGGVLATRRIYVDACTEVAKTLTFNGGTLRLSGSGALLDGPGATNGTLTVTVGDSGAAIDTGAHALTLAPPLLGAGSGGLTKFGAGTLTLTGASTYLGPTRVLGGLLRLGGAATALQPDLAVVSGCGVSLSDGALTVFAPRALAFGSAAPVTVELETAEDSAASDRLVLPAGAVLDRLAFVPVVQGTQTRSTRPGDYTVLAYTDNAPDVSRFSVPDPAVNRTYSFLLNEAEKTVTLRIAVGGTVSEWILPGSGVWETAGNWTLPPANAAGSAARLGAAILAPATVSAASPVTLGTLTFDNPNAYTLTGAGFTFDAEGATASVEAVQGAPVISAPLTLADDLAVVPGAGASITLAGAVGGDGALIKTGAGDVLVTQANTFGGGARLQQGSVVLSGAATLGSGPVTAEGGSGFRIEGTTPVTLTNELSMVNGITCNTVGADLTLDGNLTWANGQSLHKNGPHELRLSGTSVGASGARINIERGTVRFLDGCDVTLESGNRDTVLMSMNANDSRTAVIDEGARVDINGFYMEYGVSNTVVVQGGTLNMRGGGGSKDLCLLRANGAGTDRFIVNGGRVTGAPDMWFGIGIRGGASALGALIINGGTTSLGRVSMGVRMESGVFDGRGLLEVNGGRLEVTGTFNWMGDSAPGRTNWVVLGNGMPGAGTLSLPATLSTSFAAPNQPILVFNGGTLETAGLSPLGGTSLADYLYGAKQLVVNAAGARVDTCGQDVTFAQPLEAGTAGGGLTKLGAGALTLAGNCAFTGPTAVEAGTLVLPADGYASTGLSVASGAVLSLVNGVIQEQAFAAVAFQNGAVLHVEASADGSACDRIALPAGATAGALGVRVVTSGSDEPVTRPGDYTLFTCAGSVPNVSGWTLLNPAPGRVSSFETVGASVVLRVAYASGVSIWTLPSSGAWETAGNWTVPPADAPGTAVRFDDAISAPATVTRSAPSTLGALTFNNAAAYTVEGTALTLANNGSAPAVIASERGTHTLTAPLVLTSNALIQAAAGAAVALNGGVNGGVPLTVAGPGTLAVPDTAGLGISALDLTAGGMLAVSNSATLSLPVTLGAGGGGVAPGHDQTVVVEAAVTGQGPFIKDGASFLMLTNANALYAGPTQVKGGTLRLDKLPVGGGLILGSGTLHYIGGAAAAGGYTLDTGDGTRAAVLRTEGDITFTGKAEALSGALVKTGPGTATFMAAGLNVFNAGPGAGISHNVLDIGPNGESPTTGFGGFNVADGKVVIGGQGQTNLFNGLVVVGLNSTAEADAETAGTLEVVGGSTEIASELIIGRSNGTTVTAPTPRASTLRMRGGEMTVGALVLGRALEPEGHQSAPRFELSGGLLTVRGPCLWPEQAGANATVTISGGKLDHLAQDNASVRCANFGGDVTLTLSGSGELISARKLLLCFGANSTTTVNLDGGVLRVQNIEKGGSGLSGVVRFNGGTYCPTQIGVLQALTAATVGAGGAVFDLSEIDTYTVAQVMTHDAALPGADGGLTKTGAGRLILSGKQAYDGPTVIEEGTLSLALSGGVSNVTALSAAPGAALELDAGGVQTVALAGLTLGTAAPAVPAALHLTFAADGSAHDLLAVDGPVTLGEVDLTLRVAGSSDVFSRNGTYTLITYTGGDPDVAGLRVANPLYGKAYTFTAAGGAVTLTVAGDTSGASSVWSTDSSGAWEQAGNWTLLPLNAAGSRARFDSAITAPATVTAANAVTVGETYFNNAQAYTVAGSAGLTFDNGTATQAVAKVEQGSHAFTLPVTLAAAGLAVDTAGESELTFGATAGTGPLIKSGAGVVAFAQPGSRTGRTEMSQGVLVFKDGGNPGTGETIMQGSAGMRVMGDAAAELPGPLTIKNGFNVNAQDHDLTWTGDLAWQSTAAQFNKVGTNRLILAGSGVSAGASVLNVRQGELAFADGAAYAFSAASQETIKLGGEAGMKTALTIEEGATLEAGGISARCDSSGVAGGDALIVQNGGDVYLSNGNALFVRHDGTAPATYVMNGGTLEMPQTSWANLGYYGPGLVQVNGGVMRLGRVAPGYQTRDASFGKGSVHVTVNGGRLEAAGSWSWMSDGHARLTEVTVNGGTLALPVTRTYGTNAANWTSLTLDGGTLELLGPALDTSATHDTLAGARRVALGPRGGTVYTRGMEAAVAQNVASLAATGGLTVVGGGTLTLAGTNAVRGLVDVQEGTLKARFAHNGLPGMPVFWHRLDADALLADATGHGFDMKQAGAGAQTLDRFGEPNAYAFDNNVNFQIPHSALYAMTTSFTASAWIYVTAYTGGSEQSILSSRYDSGTRTFEFKLNGSGELRLLEHSSGSWWQDIVTDAKVPLSQWVHVAVSVSPQGAQLYINGAPQSMRSQNPAGVYTGVGWPWPGDIRLAAAASTAGLLIGRTHPTSGRLTGSLDDVMLYDRVLTAAEVAQLHDGSASRRVAVRVAGLGVLDLTGATQAVSEVSGCGYVVNGTLAVEERVAAGDDDAAAAGAALSVANLTLGTNAVYACSFDGAANDTVEVAGLLTVDGAGAVDFGRTEADPVTRSFTATVMTYGTVSGAANIAGWRVTGLGREGYQATVTAADGEVVVTVKATFGSVLLLK